MGNWKATAATWIRRLTEVEKWLSVGLLVTLVSVMGLQVIARYVFRSPIPWGEEVARLAMIWLTFIAAGFVAARRQHITVDLFGRGHADSSSEDTVLLRRLFAKLPAALVLLTAVLLLGGGTGFIYRVHPVGSPAVGISMSWWYGAAAVGLGLAAVHALAELLGIEAAEPDDEEAVLPEA